MQERKSAFATLRGKLGCILGGAASGRYCSAVPARSGALPCSPAGWSAGASRRWRRPCCCSRCNTRRARHGCGKRGGSWSWCSCSPPPWGTPALPPCARRRRRHPPSSSRRSATRLRPRRCRKPKHRNRPPPRNRRPHPTRRKQPVSPAARRKNTTGRRASTPPRSRTRTT